MTDIKRLLQVHCTDYGLQMDPQADNGTSKKDISVLQPLFKNRELFEGKCLECSRKFEDGDETEELNCNFFGFNVHERCYDGELLYDHSGYKCAFCKEKINTIDIVMSTCACNSTFHTICSHLLVAQRNIRIIKYGYYAGFLPCSGCGEICFDLMHPLQRNYLMLYRDYGRTSEERALFTDLYNSMFPESIDERNQYFRIVFQTNKQAWSDEYNKDFIDGFHYSKFDHFILRDDIDWKIEAKPVFGTEAQDYNKHVKFPDIQNFPYSENYNEDQLRDSYQKLKPRPRVTRVPGVFLDDIGQLVHLKQCLSINDIITSKPSSTISDMSSNHALPSEEGEEEGGANNDDARCFSPL